MGRKRKPTGMHLVQGTFRPDRHNTDEPDFGEADIQPFPDMSERAVQIWRREIRPLLQAGVLQQTDRFAFRVFCEAVEEYENAVAEINRIGLLVRDRNNRATRNPFLIIRNMAVQRIEKFGSEFGMTPHARSLVIASAGERGRRRRGLDID